MSGGFFDYGCFKISQFADELEHELDTNNDLTKDEWGYSRGAEYDKETVDNLQTILVIIELASKLAKETEWLYSGDHGEESFNALVAPMLEEIQKH